MFANDALLSCLFEVKVINEDMKEEIEVSKISLIVINVKFDGMTCIMSLYQVYYIFSITAFAWFSSLRWYYGHSNSTFTTSWGTLVGTIGIEMHLLKSYWSPQILKFNISKKFDTGEVSKLHSLFKSIK